MLKASLVKNDSKAKWIIGIFSFVVFAIIVMLGRIKLDVNIGFNVHLFAFANALINSCVAVFLVAALIMVKQKKYELHKKLMFIALILSVVFLISYIAHHLLGGETKFEGQGAIRYFYFFILVTHILIASIILPFILFTAYRALIAEFPSHKRLAKITWPLWFYVAVTGPIIYLLISPYYK